MRIYFYKELLSRSYLKNVMYCYLILVFIFTLWTILTFDLFGLGSRLNVNMLHIIHRIVVVIMFALIVFVVPYILKDMITYRIFALATAIGLTYIYMTKDFMFGFYGAYLDNSSGLIPFMYASEHFIAYHNTGRLVELDPHANFFSHYLIVYILSVILGVNYIIVYYVVYKLFFICIWTCFAVILLRYINRLYLTNIAKWLISSYTISTVLISSINGYNVGQSEATWILALFLIYVLIKSKNFSINDLLMFFFLVLAISLNSFREVLILLSISMIYIVTRLILHERKSLIYFLMSVILVITFARAFIFINIYYTIHYFNIIQEIFEAIVNALISSPGIREERLLVSIKGFQSSLDSLLTRMSIFAYALYLLLNVLFIIYVLFVNLRYLKHKYDIVFINIYTIYAFIIVFFFVLYILHITDVMSRDFSTFRTLFLALNATTPLLWVNILNTLIKKIRSLLRIIVAFILILILIFAPQYLHAIEVKSLIDTYRIHWNTNSMIFYTNNVYRFLKGYNDYKNMYFSNDYFLLMHYSGVIRYTLGSSLYSLKEDISRLNNITINTTIFSNNNYKIIYLDFNKIYIIRE
jgi:hypothetical protein